MTAYYFLVCPQPSQEKRMKGLHISVRCFHLFIYDIFPVLSRKHLSLKYLYPALYTTRKLDSNQVPFPVHRKQVTQVDYSWLHTLLVIQVDYS